jgi:acyl-CoA reductase-like NAD-dependent aldehyde dehydrogenase
MMGSVAEPAAAGELAPAVYRQFIAGVWAPAEDGAEFDDLDPYSGEVMARIPAAGRADAERAIAAAAASFPAWSARPPSERQALFLLAANIVESRRTELVNLLARETGAGRLFANVQVDGAAALLRQAANWGFLPVGEVLRSDVPGAFVMTVRQPLGVVAGFSPWNAANFLAWRTVVIPMAYGNTVVLKPSEHAPISAGLILAEILEAAGFPAGVLNVVTHAPGKAGPIADAFFESPAVRCLNFTGSSATGSRLAERAGRHLKRIVLELGGYNPLIVLADADLERAVSLAAFSAFCHQGQICMNARKIMVEQPIFDAFQALLAVKANGLQCGDPAQPDTMIGPLISDFAVRQVQDQVDDALARGARLVAGGHSDGRIFRPTVLADVPPGAAADREEIFGPVVVLQAVADAEEAIGLANASRYGLSASILTGDSQRGADLARGLNAGMVHVNGPTIWDEPHLPVGGMKDSGWGRSGLHAVEDFTEIKWTTVERQIRAFPG